MEPYVDIHNARQDLMYADLCANQWEGRGEGLDSTPVYNRTLDKLLARMGPHFTHL